MVFSGTSNIIETVIPVTVTSSRIFCCFCQIVIVIGSCPVMVMDKSNFIELMFSPSPRISISELFAPVVVVTAVVVTAVVVVCVEGVAAVLVGGAVVFVVAALVDGEGWVEPPPQAVNNNDSETKRQTRTNKNLVFMA